MIRSARRFRLIDGRDRALVLAGQAFTTLIPLMIVSAGLVGARGGASLADNLVRRFRLNGGSADTVRALARAAVPVVQPACPTARALLVARNEEKYGVIGVTFALLTWLIVLAFMIVAVVSAEIASGPRRAKPASGPS